MADRDPNNNNVRHAHQTRLLGYRMKPNKRIGDHVRRIYICKYYTPSHIYLFLLLLPLLGVYV